MVAAPVRTHTVVTPVQTNIVPQLQVNKYNVDVPVNVPVPVHRDVIVTKHVPEPYSVKGSGTCLVTMTSLWTGTGTLTGTSTLYLFTWSWGTMLVWTGVTTVWVLTGAAIFLTVTVSAGAGPAGIGAGGAGMTGAGRALVSTRFWGAVAA